VYLTQVIRIRYNSFLILLNLLHFHFPRKSSRHSFTETRPGRRTEWLIYLKPRPVDLSTSKSRQQHMGHRRLRGRQPRGRKICVRASAWPSVKRLARLVSAI